MCVIMVKHPGVAFPSNLHMKNCFDNNSDGAGMMYPAHGRVLIRKGFMTWEAFEKAYNQVKSTYGPETPFVAHFRIGTHGPKKAEGLCHPFPVTSDFGKMKAKSILTSVGFAHNGILSYLPTDVDHSDSMVYVRNILFPSLKHAKSLSKIRTVIESTIGGSKFAIMRENGLINTYGTFEEFQGVLYSNSGYSYSYTDMYDDYYTGEYWKRRAANSPTPVKVMAPASYVNPPAKSKIQEAADAWVATMEASGNELPRLDQALRQLDIENQEV